MSPDQVSFCCDILRKSIEHNQNVTATHAIRQHLNGVAADEASSFDDMMGVFVGMCICLFSVCLVPVSPWLVEPVAIVFLVWAVRLLIDSIRRRRAADRALDPLVSSTISTFIAPVDQRIAEAEQKFKAAATCSLEAGETEYTLTLDTGDEFRIEKTPAIMDLIATKALSLSGPSPDTRTGTATRLDGQRRIHPQALA